MALMVFTERFTLYLSVIAYVFLGNRLTSDKVFSIAQLFNVMQLHMSIFYPIALVAYAEAKISVQRIEVSDYCRRTILAKCNRVICFALIYRNFLFKERNRPPMPPSSRSKRRTSGAR